MSGRSRIDVINAIRDKGLIARIEWADFEKSHSTVTALVDGGAVVVEINVPPGKENDFKTLAERFKAEDPVVLLGVAPVADPDSAGRFIDAGADFITGAFDVETARLCNRNKVLYLPKIREASEISASDETGAEWVLVNADAPADLDELKVGNPKSGIVPTIGVAEHDMGAWIETGAAFLYFDVDPHAADLTDIAALRIWESALLRGLPLFSGLEHWGTYPEEGRDSGEIADWYVDLFGFDHIEGEGFHFVSSAGPGRLEILKNYEPTRGHVAVKVRHFQTAVKTLASRGIEFEPVKDFGRTKAIFFKQRDPAGNKVHLLYQAIL